MVKGALKAGTIAIGAGDFIVGCRALVVQKLQKGDATL
jgi:hypothetical protein